MPGLFGAPALFYSQSGSYNQITPASGTHEGRAVVRCGSAGLDAFESIYVREIICGQTDGANTYVGGASSPLIGPFLRCDVGLHALMDYVNDQELCVYIQIFRDFRTPGIPPPIYEVVVGRLRSE